MFTDLTLRHRCCGVENASVAKDDNGEVLSPRSSGDVDDVSQLTTNTSVYDKVASRLSQQLLAALAWTAQTSTPNADQNSVSRANMSSTSATPSRRAWELFLAQIVSNLSSKAVRGNTPPARMRPTTSTQDSSSRAHPVTNTILRPTPTALVRSTSNGSSTQQQHQPSGLRSYRQHHHLHSSRLGTGGHARPGLPRTPLNLKSPPAARINRLEISTDKPASRSWKATTRLHPLTTPPSYLGRVHAPATSSVEHLHHHRYHYGDVHHQRVIKARPAAGYLRHNSTHIDPLWSKPANQMSAASLFRVLGLWTGNDVNANATSSSITVADMMRHVLAHSTRFYSAGTSYLLTDRIHHLIRCCKYPYCLFCVCLSVCLSVCLLTSLSSSSSSSSSSSYFICQKGGGLPEKPKLIIRWSLSDRRDQIVD